MKPRSDNAIHSWASSHWTSRTR